MCSHESSVKHKFLTCSYEECLLTTAQKNTKEDPLDIVSSQVSKIDSNIKKCTLCLLHEGRTKSVPGDGPIHNLDVMIVGEAPGRNEDLAGKPFVGSGGKLLDSILKEAGLNRSEVYVTNIVKCRPPKNRKPKNDEIEMCTSNYLENQIDLLKPKLICTLGATALHYFTGETHMGESHGKLVRSKRNGYAIFPTYHPAAIFRSRPLKEVLQKDVRRIPSILKKIKDEKDPSQ
jgi:uracil-DNA glycosylase